MIIRHCDTCGTLGADTFLIEVSNMTRVPTVKQEPPRQHRIRVELCQHCRDDLTAILSKNFHQDFWQ